ncbi:hypothetical protein RBLE17_18300 [Rhodobacteraceae bacterium LE17]|jgi:peptidyl-tRNA hydrolase|nr:hypothetical protein [Rhodobacteraceae bacterium LE17]
MQIILHRRNTITELQATDPRYGVEVDIRSRPNELIIHHDPLSDGSSFEEWLSFYKHGTLILNVKEEGLEPYLVALMKKYQIKDYFFLDQSFPFLVKWAEKGLRKAAVRVSEFEDIATALSLADKIDWVWVDCFTKLSLTNIEANRLTNAGFKLCLVSPELQGRDPKTEIPEMVNLLNEREIFVDAVCTKYPNLWERFS